MIYHNIISYDDKPRPAARARGVTSKLPRVGLRAVERIKRQGAKEERKGTRTAYL